MNLGHRFVWLLTLALISSACTNIKGLSKANLADLNLSDPFFGTGVGDFQLTQVLPSQQSSGALDLSGANDEFDTFCSTLTACLCEFSYQQPGVSGNTTSTSPITYRESDLLRCTSSVPSGINSFGIRVVQVTATTTSSPTGTVTPTPTPSGVYTHVSNSLSVTLNSGAFAGSTSFLDLSNQKSYLMVNRYQCRKHEFIADPLDGSMVDPFQSEDPRVVYPFNYYTTNVSDSLLKQQQLGNQDWDCSLIGNQDRSLQWWTNPNVFSASPCTDSFCSGDGELIYPQNSLVSGNIPVANHSANGKRRSSFWLASSPYGVFTVPLNAAIAPIAGSTGYVSSTFSTIGYAAKPIANVSGSSSCPNITLPAKATWVKLWSFRATDITAPQVVTSSNSVANSAIACNAVNEIFSACDTSPTDGAGPYDFKRTIASLSTFGDSATNPAHALAARVAVLTSNSTSGSTSSASLTPNACYLVDTTSWTLGEAVENWRPTPYAFDGNVTASQIASFPWNIYAGTMDLCQGTTPSSVYRATTVPGGCSGGNSTAAPTPGPPSDSQISTTPLNGGVPYSDHLFVTTDPSINDSTMAAGMSQYQPVTYRSAADCPGTSKSGCTTNQINWEIMVKDVSNPLGNDVYPLCVLQFYD